LLLRARSGRQLQDGRVLPLTESGEHDDLTVGKLKRIVMHVGLILLDLLEPRHFPKLFRWLQAREESESMLVLDLFLERDLRAGKKTYRHVWFPDRSKTARDRVAELRRNQFVSDHGGPGCNELQTVVAH